MTKQTEALKMAIEWMDKWHDKEVIVMGLGKQWIDFSRALQACKEALEQPSAQEPLTSLDEIFADEIFRLNRDIAPLPKHLIHEIAQRNYHPELGINPVAFTAAIEKAHGIGCKHD